MAPIVIPVIVIITTGAAWYKARHLKRKMTPEQLRVYQGALEGLKDPVSLRTLAAAFRKEGYKSEAKLLEQRAALRELPKDVKEKRREIYKKALNHKDPTVVIQIAVAFEGEGATGAAEQLKRYADGLRKAAQINDES